MSPAAAGRDLESLVLLASIVMDDGKPHGWWRVTPAQAIAIWDRLEGPVSLESREPIVIGPGSGRFMRCPTSGDPRGLALFQFRTGSFVVCDGCTCPSQEMTKILRLAGVSERQLAEWGLA